MNIRISRPKSVRSIIETLESRTLLSGVSAVSSSAGAVAHNAVLIAAKAVTKAATKTTLSASAGTLGQPVTFNVTVRAAAAAGTPQGTVRIIDHGKVIQTLTLSPALSSNPKYAISDAAFTLTQTPGGSAYFFGKHTVSASFTPSGAFSKSSGTGTFTVSQPSYTSLAGGVEIATIASGSGPAIESGQTANVLYTGYLANNGHIFDDSIKDGGTPFNFVLGSGDVIPGFDAGTLGMQVGETRIVRIPPAQGYGSTRNGPIPPKSTLIFVLTLESIA